VKPDRWACREWAACAAGLFALSSITGISRAQSTDTNVVTASADAFGVAIGIEALGVYGPSEVRGFDPLAAGNARIEGMYADIHGQTIPYGPLPARLVQDTRIRVGPAAAGFPFPSPTGIVDFSLRTPLGAPGISPTVYVGPYGTSGFDLDAHAPLAGERCGVGGGLTRRWDEFLPEVTQFTTDVGFVASCRDARGSSATVFYGRTTETQQSVLPTVYLTTEPLPEPIPARGTAPDWAHGTVVMTDYGGLLRFEGPGQWTLRAGLFRSIFDQPNAGSDLLLDPKAGLADHQYVSYADQFTGSTSGELRATHLSISGPRQHEFILTLRARDVTARYGSYDQVDLGSVELGTRPAVPEPSFTYGPPTHDHTRQWTAGIGYGLHWAKVLEFAAGVEPVRYERTVSEPAFAPATLHQSPVLYYFSAGVPITARTSAYAGLTRGLEDSGLAPASASNRGELLPVSRTAQEELGVRYTLAAATTIVAGLFSVRKPYYNVGSDGSYAWLGTEIHRGLELSLNTVPLRGLTVVAGAVLMSPEVDVANGVEGVGSTPVNQPREILQLALDYQLPAAPRCSVDATVTHQGRVPVRLDNGAYNPAQTIVTVGARYRFSVGGYPATLRVQMQNATGQQVWSVIDSSGGLWPYPPLHTVLVYLSADL
jgi:iron complex outermembrane receptor protein